MKAIDIRKKRKEMNLSQKALGELIGVHGNTIYNYENGDAIPDTSYKMLQKVLFGIDIDQDSKQQRVDSKLQEIFKAKSDLIDVIDGLIAEKQGVATTIESIEQIQTLLRIKLELVDDIQKAISNS